MAANNENRRDEGLQALGAKTKYRDDYAPEVLEAFVNKHQGNDYWVRFNCPEFTSLCPSPDNPTLQRYASAMCPTYEWWRARV